MESLDLRILVASGEAVLCGVSLGGLLLLVRRIQIALGVKGSKGESHAHVSRA